jgi:hypothetical protein
MPVKKAAARTKKTARGKKPIGLTSALGPKATTMVVIVVIAAGIMVAARQQQARAKERLDAARVETIAADTTVKAKPGAAPAKGTASTPANAPSTTATSGSTSAKPITVVGCLERTDEGFRLKETSGADAPKARSWKSGFLKKSASSLDVVDTSRTLQLASHVGRRVSVTGTVDDHELLARSIRTVGACKAN